VKLDKTSPLKDAQYDKADAAAIQALANGKATEIQQVRALKFIVEKACELYGHAYRPDIRETDIALGKQHVGRQIVKLTKISLAAIK